MSALKARRPSTRRFFPTVWVGHVTAFAVFSEPGAARRSQYPMLVLMVGYTMVSLWIIAQPIVELALDDARDASTN